MASATPPPTTTRDLWRRYRAPLIAAIPAGVVLGAIADLAFSVDTVHASPQDQIPALLAYACTGAVFALVAGTGASLAVRLRRPRTLRAAPPFGRIAAGAGVAVFVGVLLIGGLSAAITHSWEWYAIDAVIAVITGLIAATMAGGITAFFEYRHRFLP